MESISGQAMAKIPEAQGIDNNRQDLVPLTPEQEILVEQGLKQVFIVASAVLKKFPPHLYELNDFVSWGTIGLIGAARLFDKNKSIKFSTFAERKIRGAILDGVRDMDPLSRDHRKFLREVEVIKRKLQNTLLRNPSEEEIAKGLGLSLDEFRAKSTEFGLIKFFPINEDVDQPKANTLDGELTKQKMERILREAIKTSLTKQERKIIEKSFLKEETQKETAKELGIHETRVSQIKKVALEKLRKILGN